MLTDDRKLHFSNTFSLISYTFPTLRRELYRNSIYGYGRKGKTALDLLTLTEKGGSSH